MALTEQNYDDMIEIADNLTPAQKTEINNYISGAPSDVGKWIMRKLKEWYFRA